MAAPTAVLIPALDEEQAIARVLAELPAAHCHQVIVIDNGSRDRTADVARSTGAEVVLEPTRGYGNACLAGLARVHPDTEVVAFLDGDHSDYPEDLPLLTGPIYEGRADLVLGSRTLLAANREFLPIHQRWGNAAALALVRLLAGRAFTDFGPFRAIGRSQLAALEMQDRTWGWNVEMQIKALHAGLAVEEVAVRYRDRIGTSKISGTVRGTVTAGSRILWTVLRHSLPGPEAGPSRR